MKKPDLIKKIIITSVIFAVSLSISIQSFAYGAGKDNGQLSTPGGNMIKNISGGWSFTIALKSDGTVWTCGNNAWGQLGNNSTTDSYVPVQVSGLSGVAAVAGGDYHTIALKSDGTVWAWGDNQHNELGNGSTVSSNVPVQVSNLSGVMAISAGGSHTIALKSDGTVWAWGYNSYGELGNNTTTNSSVPIQVSGLSGVVAVAAGSYHSIALKSDGTVWAWGRNDYGELGNNSTTNSSIPVQVNGLNGVVAISAGAYHTIVLKSDGTILTWGYNNAGQLGNNSTTNSSVPVQVSGLSGVTAISGGGYYTIALKSNGTVFTWGDNGYGQLGNNSTTNSSVPVQVSGLSSVTAISAGGFHTIALKTDGTVWTWGVNTSGRLGNGTTNNSSVPMQVSELVVIIIPPAPTISTIVGGLTDVSNNNNPSDIRIMFRGAADETKIQEYRVIASKAVLDANTAAGLGTASYVAEPVKGRGRLHLFTLSAVLKDNAGNSITKDTGSYTIYVLSYAKIGSSHSLASLGTIGLDPNVPLTGLSVPTVSDVANNGDSSDLRVTFKGPKIESDIQEYRIFVWNTSAPAFDLTQANAISGGNRYKVVTVGSGSKEGYTVTLPAGMLDTRGGSNNIINGQSYKIYILEVMNKIGTVNILSSPSKAITLLSTVPSALPVRDFTAVKVGSGHTGNNISVTFSEPLSVSNVLEYRVFICTGAGSLDPTTAAGLDNTRYIKVDSTGRGVVHTVTLTGLNNIYDGTALAAGDYKVYVLTIGKTSTYAGKLTWPSRVVKLD